MKYVISDKNEVNIGNEIHIILAHNFQGKVISAGHCDFENGEYRVFGGSTGYGIMSKKSDADILNNFNQNDQKNHN